MSRKSRAKGCRGELQIARIISAWWLGDSSLLEANAKDLPIRRTPLSGGWSSAKGIGGDLVPVSPSAEDLVFSVEVKNQECWCFDQMMKPGTGWVADDWWKQCSDAATEAGLWPILFFTKNRTPWYFRLSTCQWKYLTPFIKESGKKIQTMRFKRSVYGALSDFVRVVRKEYCIEAFEKAEARY